MKKNVRSSVLAPAFGHNSLLSFRMKSFAAAWVFAAAMLVSGGVWGQISIAALPYTPATTNFNSYNPSNAANLTATIPTGWTAASSGTAAHNGQGTGTSATGGYWAYGASGEFSLGALRSGTPGNITYTVSYTNNSGATITSLRLGWDYEQWRYANTSGFNCTGTGSLSGNAILDGKDFAGGATGTNGVVSVTSIASFNLTGLNIANGQSFGISWVTTDISGSDNGISIDNFSITAVNCSALTITATVATSPVCAGGDIDLNSTPAGGTTPYTTFAWGGPNSYASSVQDPAAFVSTSLSGGTYTVTVTDNAGCTASNTVAVTVNAQPTGPTLLAKTPNVGTICTGQGVSATFNPGTGGTVECDDDYVVIIDGGSPVAYTPGSTVGAGATMSIVIQGRRDCTIGCRSCPGGGTGCTGTDYVDLASWTVVADPTAPALNTPTPANGTTVCTGASVSATITPGTGGTGTCTDTYQFSTDNGSTWSAYTSGAPITAGTMTVKIQVKRDCDGLGCDGSAETFAVIASWPVVADPTAPALNVPSPANGTTVCTGASVSATITPGSGGTGTCTDTYQFSTDNGSTWSAYTSGDPITAGTMTVKIQVKRDCDGLGCDGAAETFAEIASWPVVADPTAPALNTPTPANGTTVCTGASVSATITPGTGGTGTCTDTYQFSTDNGSTWSTYTSGAAITAGTMTVKIQTKRDCSGIGCDGTAETFAVIASWPVVADPTAPVLLLATPSSGTFVCEGATVSATITPGSGGTGTCADTYQVSTDNGSTWSAYTSGSPIIAGTMTVKIRVKRDCDGLGCDGAAETFAEIANWPISQEINVQGNLVTITDGDISPSLADHTDFGTTAPSVPIVRTFTIQNLGGQPLTITPITKSGVNDFTVGALSPASPIPAGMSATFTVTFNSAAGGIQTSTITIANNDCGGGEDPYTFEIKAEVVVGCSFPVFSPCPAPLTASTAAGLCTAVVSYTATATGSPNPTLAYVFTGMTTGSGTGTGTGSTFNKGVTNVVITATNICGSTTCSFTVTVNDAQKPTITCPANKTQGTDLGECEADVTYLTPTASDNCNPAPTVMHISGGTGHITGNPNSSATFQKGATIVTWKATDASGNTKTCTFKITVNDLEKPMMNCLSDINANNDAGLCSAVVSYTLPTFTDNCPPTSGQSVKISGPASGSAFSVGTTNVVYRATDASGNTKQCTMKVTVTDTEPPTIVCPDPIVVTGSGTPCTAVAVYATPTASDNCSGSLTPFLLSGLASGSSYPAGVTTNTWRAIAANAQSADCSFTVTVHCPEGMINGGGMNGGMMNEGVMNDESRAAFRILNSAFPIPNSAFHLSPNPTSGFVWINLSVPSAAVAQLNVMNLLGQSLLRRALNLSEGENQFDLDLQLLPTGTYLVRVVVGKDQRVMKLVKE
ncbi:MAG: HYR domain-containing protein [Saprospiraceae bacterium]